MKNKEKLENLGFDSQVLWSIEKGVKLESEQEKFRWNIRLWKMQKENGEKQIFYRKIFWKVSNKIWGIVKELWCFMFFHRGKN